MNDLWACGVLIPSSFLWAGIVLGPVPPLAHQTGSGRFLGCLLLWGAALSTRGRAGRQELMGSNEGNPLSLSSRSIRWLDVSSGVRVLGVRSGFRTYELCDLEQVT